MRLIAINFLHSPNIYTI